MDLNEGNMDYALSILRHQIAGKGSGLSVSLEDLTRALTIVCSNDEHTKGQATQLHQRIKEVTGQTTLSFEHFIGPCSIWDASVEPETA